MLGVYTIVKPAADDGWGVGRRRSASARSSLALLVAFVAREATARNAAVPLRIFRSRNVTGANLVQVLSVAGMFGMFFLGSLYLQRVLGYDALRDRLRVPARDDRRWARCRSRYSEQLIMRFGARTLLLPGLA